MTSQLHRDIEAIFQTALDSVRANDAVRRNLEVIAHRQLRIADQSVQFGAEGIFAIAIGKAAVAMIDAAAEVVGDRFTAGLAVSKSESASRHPQVTVLHGAHPVPDQRSLDAGRAVLQFARDVPDGAVVLCLISGGGSSLVEQLRDGVDLSRLQELTTRLLRAGASIQELNVVRSRLSRTKAGGLLCALRHAQVHNLIVSDVLGDDLNTIASGPTVPPIEGDPNAILREYGIDDHLPSAERSEQLALPPTTVVANLSLAIDRAAESAIALGYQPIVLTRSLSGEAREVGRMFGAILEDSAAGRTSFGHRTCLLAGGETTVTVRGSGHGGRNTEAALAAAIRLSGAEGVAVGFLATDGDDAATGAAGAIIDGKTVVGDLLRDAEAALAENDSYMFLRRRDAGVVTGPTGTNVNDLVIGLIG